MNLPGIPQCEKYDFFIFRTILPTSKGEVFRTSIEETPSFLVKFGTGSSGFFTGVSWGFVDFKMAANEIALTQPKFELGITGIIHNVFQGD